MKQKAKFITFEGGEGTGKTTQIKLLKQFLTEQGIKVKLTREPGGCPQAEKIRDILVQGKPEDLDTYSELLLYSAARHEHVRQKIKPLLEQNYWVISDRFYLSTYAYQGYAGGYDMNFIQDITKKAIKGCEPDLIFFLNLDPQQGLKRALDSGLFQHERRFEAKDIEYHTKLYNGYLSESKKDDKIIVINADQSIEKVHLDIVTALSNFSVE